MPTLTSIAGRPLRALDRVAGTQLHGGVRAGLRVAGALGPGLRGRARILGAAIALALGHRRRPVRIPVGAGRWFAVPDLAGLRVLEEVFCDGEYAAPLPLEPRHILDLGANIGASVLFFSRRYPHARITAVEASPELFGMLESNVGDLPNVTLHHAAVSRTAEPVIFYPSRSSWAGSTQPNDWTRSEDATEVPGQALDELLANDVDLMKVDIEGGEFDILPASERLPSLRAVLGEIHAPPRSADAERLLALFEDFEVLSTEPDPAGEQYATVFSAVRAPQQASRSVQ